MESATKLSAVFGFQDFWRVAYKEHERRFDAVTDLVRLANEMFVAVEKKQVSEPVEKVVYVLSRVTTIGMNEVVLLCGNGCGTGAMKIARGMFESSITAEYLRRNPNEVQDYVDFGRVLMRRRYQWLLGNSPEEAKRMSPERAKNIEDEYNRVKAQFTDAKGRVRNQWSAKSIASMAEELGRRDQYDLSYSLGASIHHANAEGLLANVDLNDGKIVLDAPPSMEWLAEALIAAHANFLMALDALNDCCNLGFTDRLKGAEQSFHKAWQKSPE